MDNIEFCDCSTGTTVLDAGNGLLKHTGCGKINYASFQNKQISELKAEIERLKKDNPWPDLLDDNQKLRDALKKYGRHQKDCAYGEDGRFFINGPCRCGFDQALSEKADSSEKNECDHFTKHIDTLDRMKCDRCGLPAEMWNKSDSSG